MSGVFACVAVAFVAIAALPASAATQIKLLFTPGANNLAFWMDVARDQGMIKGNPDPANLVAP